MKSILRGLFIIGGCILAFVFNPYIGLVRLPVETLTNFSFLFRAIALFVVLGYVTMNFIIPAIISLVNKLNIK